MLPELEQGVLPPGIHPASLDEVEAAFGWNQQRTNLLVGLRRAIQDLKRAGCRRVWLDGSFVTEKDVPGDYDMCWDMEGVDIGLLAPPLVALDPPRALQKAHYGGDILPNVIETDSAQPFIDFFQQDSVTGAPRGIVEIDLGKIT